MKKCKQSLTDLVHSAQSGDQKSKSTIYTKYYRILFSICRRYTTNKEQAEDWVNDGFVKIFAKIHEYTHRGSFEGWIKHIVINNIIDQLRVVKPQLQLHDEFIDSSIEESDNEEPWYYKIPISELSFHINNISPGYRKVLQLKLIAGMKHSEISKLLGISEGSSKSNYTRARNILRTKLIKKYERYTNSN